MTTKVKIWQIKDNKLESITTTLKKEGRKESDNLEQWIKQCPEILGENLLLIGNQIYTKSGPLDFLAIDENGNIVVIELKRHKIARKALAQAIDYASDLASWSIEELDNACSKFTGQNLEDYITENFPNKELVWDDIPINQSQRIILVGLSIGESLERMINWLSENFNVLINAIIITYGKTISGDEVIAATSIIPEEIEEEHRKRRTKKISPKTLEDHQYKIKNEKLRDFFFNTESKIKALSKYIEELPRIKYIVFKHKGTVVAKLYPRQEFFAIKAYENSPTGPKESEWLEVRNEIENREEMFEKIKRYISYLDSI